MENLLRVLTHSWDAGRLGGRVSVCKGSSLRSMKTPRILAFRIFLIKCLSPNHKGCVKARLMWGGGTLGDGGSADRPQCFVVAAAFVLFAIEL